MGWASAVPRFSLRNLVSVDRTSTPEDTEGAIRSGVGRGLVIAAVAFRSEVSWASAVCSAVGASVGVLLASLEQKTLLACVLV